MIDGGNGATEPIVLEQWQLIGCYLKDVNYNTLDYGTSEAVKISMTITYDNAVQDTGSDIGPGTGNGGGGGVGTVTNTGPRTIGTAV